MSDYTTPTRGRLRGFQLLTPERRREIAIQGGKTAHAKGTAHQWTKESARAAGALGHANRKRKARSITEPDRLSGSYHDDDRN